jgi:hypothetical protein
MRTPEERKIALAAAAARYAELRDARRAERAEADARSLQLDEVIEVTGRMLRQARMYTAPESHLKTLVADFERRYS